MKTTTYTYSPTEQCYSVRDRGAHVEGNLNFKEAEAICLSMPGSQIAQHGKNKRIVDTLSFDYVRSFA